MVTVIIIIITFHYYHYYCYYCHYYYYYHCSYYYYYHCFLVCGGPDASFPWAVTCTLRSMHNIFCLRLESCVHRFVLHIPPATQLWQSILPHVYNAVFSVMHNISCSSLSGRLSGCGWHASQFEAYP